VLRSYLWSSSNSSTSSVLTSKPMFLPRGSISITAESRCYGPMMSYLIIY
jgi:hypothetical protein